MHIRLTLAGSGGGATPTDVMVMTSEPTTVHDLRPHLVPWLPRRRALYADGRPLSDDAVLGAPPLVHGAVLSDASANLDDEVLQGVLQIRVVGGPYAGAVHRVVPGEITVGRAAGNVVRIDDPDVSRVHVSMTSDASGLYVRDLQSTNGTFIDDELVPPNGMPFLPGQLLRAGNSALTLVVPSDDLAATTPDGKGQLLVNRPPRIRPRAEVVRLRYPTEPRQRDAPRVPWVAIVLPLILGAVMFAVMGNQPMWLAFMLLSPLLLIGNVVSERFVGRRRHGRERRAYESEMATARERIADAVAGDVKDRRDQSPDPAALLLMARQPLARLWERRRVDDDFLSLRIGLADLPCAVLVEGLDAGSEQPTAKSVPVVVSLRAVGVLGVAGPRRHVESLCRWLAAQLVTLHSPHDLHLVLLIQGAAVDTWSWVTRLPHVLPQNGQNCTLLVGLDDATILARITELLAVLDARQSAMTGGSGDAAMQPAIVAIVDGSREIRGHPGVARLLAEGPAVGIYAMGCSAAETDLPGECGGTAVFTGAVGATVNLRVRSSPDVTGVLPDGVPVTWADRLARALAPLRDATPLDGGNSLPTTASLLEELDLEPRADVIVTGWEAHPRSTSACLGVSADGPFAVDLAADGPHVLVAGTTGSGKSELLQTLIASLAIGNRPDQMAFLLVDYKGGSAFGDCGRLPHCVGLVTDLDEHLTERALVSLDAELTRREHVLRDAAAKDITAYQEIADRRDLPALPRLVLVVDEFAALVNELPDFIRGLVDIAQRGRSLGVHLVLATQRPGGVVSADIRANTGLRIALRVTDPSESSDVIDVKHAAYISRDTPGRAYARVATGGATAFQTARVGNRQGAQAAPTSLWREEWSRMGDPPRRPTDTRASGPTDLSLLVDALCEATTLASITPPAKAWLTPLPTAVTLDELPDLVVSDAIPIGVCDLPEQQAQRAFAIDLAHGGHVLVVGGPRSGRTTALRTIAGSLARSFVSSDCHLYVIDCASGGLAPLGSLPHCGTVVTRDETERGSPLLNRLMDEVLRRQEALRPAGFSSVAEHRDACSSDERLPWMVLLVDGWDGFQTAYESVDAGRPVDTMLRLLREGSAAGLRIVMTGDRSALVGRVGSLASQRLVLRMSDPLDYSLAGLSPRSVPNAIPPGRGFLVSGSVETQIALLTSDPAGPAQTAAVCALAETDVVCINERIPPIRIEPLPTSVRLEQAAAAVQCPTAEENPLWALIGVGGDAARPLGVDLRRDGPAFVIAGPPRSGRSSLLAAMASWFSQRNVSIAAVAPQRSRLRDLAGQLGVLAVSDGRDVDALRDAAEACPGSLVLLADDAEMLLDSPAEHVLIEVLKHAESGAPRALVVAGATDRMASTYRGITVEARRSRCGFLLSPGSSLDGELLGVRVPKATDQRPGRGVLVMNGEVQPIQAIHG